jgi:hypothetical protein
VVCVCEREREGVASSNWLECFCVARRVSEISVFDHE